jgi:hypothetical protein
MVHCKQVSQGSGQTELLLFLKSLPELTREEVLAAPLFVPFRLDLLKE